MVAAVTPAVGTRTATPEAAFTVEQFAVVAGSTAVRFAAAEASMVAADSTVVDMVEVATAGAGNVLRLKLEKAGSISLPAFFCARPFLAPLLLAILRVQVGDLEHAYEVCAAWARIFCSSFKAGKE
jgi:hypothetical protein